MYITYFMIAPHTDYIMFLGNLITSLLELDRGDVAEIVSRSAPILRLIEPVEVWTIMKLKHSNILFTINSTKWSNIALGSTFNCRGY